MSHAHALALCPPTMLHARALALRSATLQARPLALSPVLHARALALRSFSLLILSSISLSFFEESTGLALPKMLLWEDWRAVLLWK